MAVRIVIANLKFLMTADKNQEYCINGRPVGRYFNSDIAGDGVPTLDNNCPDIFNPDQADFDSDRVGDKCEVDSLYLRDSTIYCGT